MLRETDSPYWTFTVLNVFSGSVSPLDFRRNHAIHDGRRYLVLAKDGLFRLPSAEYFTPASWAEIANVVDTEHTYHPPTAEVLRLTLLWEDLVSFYIAGAWLFFSPERRARAAASLESQGFSEDEAKIAADLYFSRAGATRALPADLDALLDALGTARAVCS